MRAAIGHFLAVGLLLAGASSSAMTQADSAAWVGDAPIIESVADIMARAAATPASSPRPARPRLRKSQGGGSAPAAAIELSSPAGPSIAGPLAPQTVGTSFLAVQSSESAFYPPDSMGAVGPTQILVCVNGRIKVFDRAGTLDATVLNVTTDTFFNSVRNGASASDCRVRFDPDSKRWFVSMINVPTPTTANNRIMIAVSQGATITPSSLFSFFQFEQDLVAPAGNSNQFADYPTLGIDKNALYLGVNMFTAAGAFTGSSGFVVQKSSVLGAGPIVVTAFRGLATNTGAGAYTPQGVDNDDPAATKGFFVGIDVSTAASTKMTAVRVLNPGSSSPAPSVDATLNITVPTFRAALGGVPALGSTTVLDDVDNRLMMAQMKNGSLWTVHTTQVNASGTASATGGRDGARWYEVKGLMTASPGLNQSGTLYDSSASNPASYFVPSIAASGQGHVALGSTVAGAGEHAEIALSGRLSGDALGTLRTPTVAQTSATVYNLDPSDPAQRWGDFSFTCVDPNDNMTLWTFQEYCNASNSWGVRVLQLRAPPPATPASVSSTQVAQNQPSVNVTLTGASVSGSGFYDPGAGFPNRLAVTASGGVVVNSVTVITPTTITLNLSTAAATLGPQDLTVTNPDGQSLTGTGLFTVTTGAGAPACVVTPNGTATNLSPIVFTLSFNEAVSGFSGGGVTLTNGSAGLFTPVDAATYTLAVTPTTEGLVTCQVNAGAAHALSDNQTNLASTTASVFFDTTPPTSPGTPGGLPNPSAGTFTVSWTTASDPGGSGVASYTVERSDNGAAFAIVASGVTALTLAQTGLLQGSYQYRVSAVDMAGNAGPPGSGSLLVVVDLTPPGAPGTPSGSPNPNSTGTFTVNWTAASDSGGSGVASYTVQRSGNGAAFATIASGLGVLSLAQSGLPQGSYRYQVFAIDAAGNIGSVSAVSPAVIVDKTGPGAPGTPAGSPNPNSGTFTVNWTAAADAGGSGVAGYTVQRSDNGAAFATVASGIAGLTLPQSGLAQGSYRYQVTAVDAVGNIGAASASSVPVVVDTTAPGAPGMPVGSPIPNSGSFTVSWTGSTDAGGSGVASYTVQRSDNGAAFATIATGVVGLTLPQSGLAQGSYRYQVIAVDGVGNVGPASPVSSAVPVYTTLPGTPGTPSGAPNPNNTGIFAVSWTAATDASGPGVASYTVQRSTNGAAFATIATGVVGLTLPQSGLPQGSYRYQVLAVDTVGNVGPASAASPAVVVDTTAPLAPGTPVGAPALNNTGSFTVSWTAAADAGGSGVATYSVQRSANGGGFVTVASGVAGLTLSQTALAAGSYVYQVQAVDAAGNPGAPSSPSAPVIVDTIAPSAPGAPVGSPNPTSGSFTLTWTAATDTGGSGVASYTVQRSINGGAFSTVASGVAGLSLVQNGQPQGAYRFMVQALDGAGNIGGLSAPSLAVLVLKTAPHTTLVAEPPNPSSSAGATFVFSSSVPDGTFQTKLDAAASWTSNGTATVISYSGLANGSHTFQVRAVDAVGNVDPTPASYVWTVNTSGGVTQDPDTIVTGQPPATTAQTSATFTFISTEPGGTFDVQLDGGGWSSNGASGTKTYSALPTGTHTFQVRAVDTALNVDPTPASVAWTIVAPPADQVAPVLNPFSDDAALTHWTIASTDSGVTWSVDATPALMPGGPFFSAPSSLNYNNGTDYDTPGIPNSGSATSPLIAINGLSGARLKFFCNYQTETLGTDHDHRGVQISNDGFATLLVDEALSTSPGSVVAGTCTGMGTWHEHVVSLAGMTGPIQVRFLFDTGDAGLNNFGGWFIDDFEISDLAVSGLDQLDAGTGRLIPVGGTVASSSVTLGGVVSRDTVSAVTLEIEVQPVATSFTGVATATAIGSGPGSAVSVSLSLANGSYHWRARTVTGGVASSWMSFGLNAESDPDFVIQVPGSAGPATGAAGGGHHGCGLTGMEGFLGLLILVYGRRGQRSR